MYAFLLGAFALSTTAQLFTSPQPLDNILWRRQSSSNATETYITSVCSPNITSPVPPCIEVTTIEEACTPNGTASIDLIAHAECMCGGSFFSDWTGCLQCQYVHGARSEAEVDEYNSIISTVSNELCTGTPTAAFTALFNNASNTAAAPSGVATVLSDQYPSQSAISLYYTVSGIQGPGAITGSATLATKAASVSVTSSAGVAGSLASSGLSGSATRTVSSASGSATSAAGSSTAGSASAASASASATKTGGAARMGDGRVNMGVAGCGVALLAGFCALIL